MAWLDIIWDLDLTFGKFFEPDAVDIPERPVGTLNDLMLSDPEVNLDLNPWFGSTVLGNPLSFSANSPFGGTAADGQPTGIATPALH